MDDRPTYRPYARLEFERRFIVDALPASVDPEDFERLEDLFVAGTYLRLRRVTKPDGRLVTTKLGQKILAPRAPTDPRQRQMTTIYLSEGEGQVLAEALAGTRASKRRYKLQEQGHTFCIDVWEAPASAAGIVLAEVEADSIAELEGIEVPLWASAEVTQDPRYSAIRLARPGLDAVG